MFQSGIEVSHRVGNSRKYALAGGASRKTFINASVQHQPRVHCVTQGPQRGREARTVRVEPAISINLADDFQRALERAGE